MDPLTGHLLYGFVFHYNDFIGKWQVASRDDYNQLFSGGSGVISSSSIDTLIDIISKTNGDLSQANSLIND